MATGADERGRVRASDGEREQYAELIRAAMSEGRLTLDEGEERLAGLYASRYRDELPTFTQDLPAPARKAEEAGHEPGKLRQEHRWHLFGHGAALAGVAAILIGLWALSGAHVFWPAFPLLFMAFGFLRHLRYRRWMRWHGGHGPWGGPGPWQRPGPWEHHEPEGGHPAPGPGPWGPHGPGGWGHGPGGWGHGPAAWGAHGCGRREGWHR